MKVSGTVITRFLPVKGYENAPKPNPSPAVGLWFIITVVRSPTLAGGGWDTITRVLTNLGTASKEVCD